MVLGYRWRPLVKKCRNKVSGLSIAAQEDIMEPLSDKRFPLDAKDYKLYEEVGEGVSATVFRALCIPINEIVAIKVLDLEKCNNDLDGIRREVQTMSLIDHPNVLRAHCSFTAGHSLWVVMPYMSGGSCLHIMKSNFPEGFEETVIATLLREVLRALVYLHAHGHIHRDVKAGNILVDFNGAVKLADFGVSACMFDTGDRQRSRNTFVGTPCWMAPEVMQQLHGYDFKADIWSLGITALELAHGHAPFSKYPPMKVLLMTLQNAPPGLDYERDKRFSKSFKDLVAACLVKDPKKRPTSEKLIKHPFFKQAHPVDHLARTILEGLSPLGDRFKMLKAKEADLLLQNKGRDGDRDQLSQQEYIRGISAWNFNLDDLKNQAALIQDDDDDDDDEGFISIPEEMKKQVGGSSLEQASQSNPTTNEQDEFNDLHDLKSSLASYPIKPLQALKGCFDVCEDDAATSPRATYQENGRTDGESAGKSSYLPRSVTVDRKKYLSGTLLLENTHSPRKVMGDVERDYQRPKSQPERNYSGSLLYRQKREANNPSTADDTSEGAVVQRKGRFKVTSAELSPKGPTNSSFNPVAISGGLMSPTTVSAATILPSLQFILQQNAMQREEVLKLIKYVEQTSGKQAESPETSTSDFSLTPSLRERERERELQSQVNNMQQRVGSLIDELQRQKMRNIQLERQLNALSHKDGE